MLVRRWRSKQLIMIKTKLLVTVSLLLIFVGIQSCKKLSPTEPLDEDILAGTIPGLSLAQEQEHLIGDAFFGELFTAKTGLGPIYVQNACASCHVGNGKGHPSTMITRFAKVDANGNPDYLLNQSGF